MARPWNVNPLSYDPVTERIKAESVMARYFDVDITNADAAYEVLVDNGIHPQYAAQLAQDMYPEVN